MSALFRFLPVFMGIVHRRRKVLNVGGGGGGGGGKVGPKFSLAVN